MTRSVDVTKAEPTGEVTTESHRFRSGTYKAVEIEIEGERFHVPVTGIENQTTPTYDADRVYVFDDRIIVEGWHDGQLLETHLDGSVGTDGELLFTDAHAVDVDQEDYEPIGRTLWALENDPRETMLPTSVLRDRGPLSVQQAVIHWLCDDPDGPELTQEDAATAVGTTRDQLWTQLRRAREKLDK